MFDRIAPTYDVLNHVLSFGIDRRWRQRVMRLVTGNDILDVATGTGDLAIAMARRLPHARITGVDISEGMLERGRGKIAEMSGSVSRRGRTNEMQSAPGGRRRTDEFYELDFTPPNLQIGDAQNLQFPDATFDCVTAAFGVRNFGDKARGLSEMYRVLRRGGRCIILEFSEPRSVVWGAVYRWYFHNVLPLLGRLISRDKGAYTYLPRSVGDFPPPERFAAMMLEAGFSAVEKQSLTGGVAYIYIGNK